MDSSVNVRQSPYKTGTCPLHFSRTDIIRISMFFLRCLGQWDEDAIAVSHTHRTRTCVPRDEVAAGYPRLAQGYCKHDTRSAKSAKASQSTKSAHGLRNVQVSSVIGERLAWCISSVAQHFVVHTWPPSRCRADGTSD